MAIVEIIKLKYQKHDALNINWLQWLIENEYTTWKM